VAKNRRPGLAALPRKRSAAALSLQSARHRHRVIPDKRAAENERIHKETARRFGPALRALSDGNDHNATGVWWADFAQCYEWETKVVHGLCRNVRCEHCPLFGDVGDVESLERPRGPMGPVDTKDVIDALPQERQDRIRERADELIDEEFDDDDSGC
jgi:hypothetical protein